MQRLLRSTALSHSKGIVSTVTERLFAAEATLTPEIGLSRFYFDRDWAPLGYDRRVVHRALSFRVVAVITTAS